MPAHDQVELLVRKRQCQGVAQLEPDALTEPCASRPRAFEMLPLQIDPHEGGTRILRGHPFRDLGGSATEVEHRSVSEGMPVEDRLFLRPDGLRL